MRYWILGALTALLLVACGGTAAEEAAAPTGGGQAQATPPVVLRADVEEYQQKALDWNTRYQAALALLADDWDDRDAHSEIEALRDEIIDIEFEDLPDCLFDVHYWIGQRALSFNLAVLAIRLGNMGEALDWINTGGDETQEVTAAWEALEC